MTLREAERRLGHAVDVAMNTQEKEMISNGGLKFRTALGLQVVAYDEERINFARQIEEDAIIKEIDFMVMREEMTEDDANFIKESL